MQSDVPKQLVYGAMVYVRQTIVSDASNYLSRAVCIAVRYSAVRRQFGSQAGGPEVQDGIEDCRKLCGGHGYLCSSGLPELFAVYVPACTYEGDNTVLLLQGMFIPAIKGQATDEQQQEWLPLAYKMQIIGCYAQTELGHGSNVQGLETTAAFDPNSDEFIINSPTLTSSKWWPGGLGKVSTHAIVYARLITNGHDYGVHAFLVQIRSLEDHQPLPGVTVADIGMKFGNGAYNTVDNGLLQFDHIRIPRKQMLMRFIEKVQQDIPGEGIKRQLEGLCSVYSLSLLHNHRGDFLSTGYLTGEQAALATDQLRVLYSQVRPNAVALVDAFNYTDHFLGSVLGRYDGNVYPHLYEEALKDPLNESVIPEGYQEYIRPVLKQQVRIARL